MKSKYKYVLLLLFAAMAGVVMLSCSDSDEHGKPFINYVRVTNPKASDSLLVTAGQGQIIAIIGSNLGAVHEVWFNDRAALIYPTFITDNAVITQVPSKIPGNITNKLKMKFANGDSLLYDFIVDINKPRLDYVRSEYENEGDSLFIYGDYFYAPITVEFNGNQEAEILSIDEDGKNVVVKVPAGAASGPVTVTTNFGVTESDFWFKDQRNIIANFDGPFSGAWKGSDFVVSSDPKIQTINGNFIRVNKGKLGAWPFLEVFGGPGGDIAAVDKNIPELALVDPGSYSLKFECSTLAPTAGAVLRLYIGNGTDFDYSRQHLFYEWKANLDTKGNWTTVTIPWADVYTANQQFPYNESGYGLFMYFHGPNEAIYNLAMDNIRVVPNTTK